jgi:hypothetical protein
MLTVELSSKPTTMCAAGRAETFWVSICDTPCDFPLRVLVVSWRGRPSPRLLGVAASGSARHAMSASFARPGVRGSPCVLNTGRLAGKARLAWGRSRSYGVTLGTVSLSRRHVYLCTQRETATRLWTLGLLECPHLATRRGRVGRIRLWPPCDGLSCDPRGPMEIKLPSIVKVGLLRVVLFRRKLSRTRHMDAAGSTAGKNSTALRISR